MNSSIRRAIPGGRRALLAYLAVLVLAVLGMSSQASAAGEVPVPVSSCSVSDVNGQAEVTWTPGPGAAGNVDRYVVHRQTTTGGPFVWRAAPRVPATSFTDSSALTPTTTYRVAGRFETQTSAKVICGNAPTNNGPVPVSSCSAAEVNGVAVVSWTPGPGAVGTVDRYAIHRQTAANGPFAWRAVRTAPETSYTDATGLTDNTTYRVTARLGTQTSAKVICGNAPTNNGPVPVSSCSAAEVNGVAVVSWTPGPGAVGTVDRYAIHRQTAANGPFAWRAVRTAPETSYTDATGLTDNTTYRVTARLGTQTSAKVICGNAPTSAGGAKLIAVGDMNHCDSGRSPGAASVSSMLGELRYVNRRVLLLGDIAYPGGTVADFNCFHDTFGAHKGRMLPTPGNHEYGIGATNPTPAAYIDYFRNRNSFSSGYGPLRRVSFASRSHFDELYYEVTGIDGWQILMLNSNCFKPNVDTDGNGSLDSNSCDEGSPQYNWVRDKITAAGTGVCRAVAWHHPLWRTPKAGDPLFTQVNQLEMMELLSDTGTDLILSGHAHKYERFLPQDVTGTRDPNGFQLFTIGTGGTALNPVEDPQVIAPNSAQRIYAHGLSEFTFSAGSYSWKFETTNGTIADQGQRNCSPKSLPG